MTRIAVRMKSLLKTLAVRALTAEPVLRMQVERITRSGDLTVLNLHRVDDDQTSAYQAIPPGAFDELVGWLKERFRIVTFAELEAEPEASKPPLVLSFDDGYRDFINVVAPILHKHGVRANQNVIPHCAETGCPPMNVMLQDFIGAAPATLLREVRFPGLPQGADPDDRIRSGLVASSAFKNRPIAEQKKLFGPLLEQFHRFDGFRPTPMMTPHEIRTVAAEHEIGAHSFEHATLSFEESSYVEEDLIKCSKYFTTILHGETEIFAFPNGRINRTYLSLYFNKGYRKLLGVINNSNKEIEVIYRNSVFGMNVEYLKFRVFYI